MIKSIVVGNWKMNTTPKEGVKLFNLLRNRLGRQQNVEVVICPPFTHLPLFDLKKSSLNLGAQNLWTIDEGPVTGEISAKMLTDLGVSFVIVGHSERKEFFNEDNKLIAKKFEQTLKNGLTPILCVGENLRERKNGQTLNIILTQIKEVLEPVIKDSPTGKIRLLDFIIAYEPVWSIGTGDTPSPDEIRNVANVIHEFISSTYSKALAKNTMVLYGGSVGSDNAGVFIANKHISGFLVGGASLDISEFTGIVKACKK